MNMHLARGLALGLAVTMAAPAAQAQVSGTGTATQSTEVAPSASSPNAAGQEMRERRREMRERRGEMRDRRREMRGERREAREDRGRTGAHRRAGRRYHHRGMHPAAARMVFLLIDTDGNGILSLAEVNAVTTRFFNAADANSDGELAVEEIRQFMRSMRSRGWTPTAADADDDDMDDDDENDTQ